MTLFLVVFFIIIIQIQACIYLDALFTRTSFMYGDISRVG